MTPENQDSKIEFWYSHQVQGNPREYSSDDLKRLPMVRLDQVVKRIKIRNIKLEQRKADFRIGPGYKTQWAVLGFGAIQNEYDFVDPMGIGFYVPREKRSEDKPRTIAGDKTISLGDAWKMVDLFYDLCISWKRD